MKHAEPTRRFLSAHCESMQRAEVRSGGIYVGLIAPARDPGHVCEAIAR